MGSLIQSLQGPEAPRLDQLCQVPSAVGEAVARGLARDPNQRFASCGELAQAVRLGFTGGRHVAREPARPRPGTAQATAPSLPAATMAAPGRSPDAAQPARLLPIHSPPATPAPPPAVAPTVVASPGITVPPPVPPTPVNVPAGNAIIRANQSPVEPASAPPPLSELAFPPPTRRTHAVLFQLKRILSQPAVLGSVITAGVAAAGILLLAILYATLRPDRVSQNQAGSERPSRHWRVGENNLTMEEAVVRAQDGDTIELPEGRFTLNQSIIVRKSLTIRGAGRDKSILQSAESDFAIKFTGECQWTLRDLTLEHIGNKPADVVMVDSGTITITNCVFSGAVWDAQASRGGDGIWLPGTARAFVSNCVCRNNGQYGIQVTGQAHADLEGNTCEGNKGSGIAYFGNAAGTARNNTCVKNGQDGIQVADQAQPVLEGNTCEGNTRSGIAYFDNAAGTARNNTCVKNAYHGIGVSGQAQPLLEGNTCEANEGSGIAYFDNAAGTARNNICRNNGLNGIYVLFRIGPRPKLEGNVLAGNKLGDLNVE